MEMLQGRDRQGLNNREAPPAHASGGRRRDAKAPYVADSRVARTFTCPGADSRAMTRCVLMLACVLALGACRTPLAPQAFDPRARPIERVAVLPVHHDEQLMFEYANDQLRTLNRLAPGPLGSALSGAVGAAGRADFNEAVGLSPASYAEAATAGIVAALAAAGFTAVAVPADRLSTDEDRRGGLLVTVPPEVRSLADVVLDGYLELGFVAAGRGQPYRPAAWLTLRLSGPEGRVLLEDRIMFNASTADESNFLALRGIKLHPPAWLQFRNAAAILVDDRADRALRYALDRLLAEVRFLFRGPWL